MDGIHNLQLIVDRPLGLTGTDGTMPKNTNIERSPKPLENRRGNPNGDNPPEGSVDDRLHTAHKWTVAVLMIASIVLAAMHLLHFNVVWLARPVIFTFAAGVASYTAVEKT